MIFQFKYNPRKQNEAMPRSFAEEYTDSKFKLITPSNIEEFLLPVE